MLTARLPGLPMFPVAPVSQQSFSLLRDPHSIYISQSGTRTKLQNITARLATDRLTCADEEWAEAGAGRAGPGEEGGLVAVQPWGADREGATQPLSSRFFQQRSRSGSSPAAGRPGAGEVGGAERGGERGGERASARDRFRGAKQLFLSLERKKDRLPSASPARPAATAAPSPHQRTAAKLERLLGREAGGAAGPGRGSGPRVERQQSPPPNRPNMFIKSGKKSSGAVGGAGLQSRRLSRFLSRETLESDGYDRIEEFEEVEPPRPRAKVSRQPSRTSLGLPDYRQRGSSRDSGRGEEEPEPGPRRGFIRREVTELDLTRYRGPREGGAGPGLWGGPAPARERAVSPARLAATRILPPEFRGEQSWRPGPHGPPDRFPSLDLRSDKRRAAFTEAEVRLRHPEPNTDYRRRSYHELSGTAHNIQEGWLTTLLYPLFASCIVYTATLRC